MNPGPALSVRGVSVTLGGTTVLRDVDLDVSRGEVVALVGPNGAGKSTLLGVLAGDVETASGTVELAGRAVWGYSARELARRRAVQQQHQELAFGFRVHEVVTMGRAPWRRSDREDRDETAVVGAMADADVTHLGVRHFPTLSGGEQARTSFARLLAQQAPLLLLDEPTASLDIRHQESLLQVVREATLNGSAAVIVLHDLSLAAAYADRICLLAAGSLRAEGPPAAVLTPELLSEVYDHPVDVIRHHNNLVVVPARRRTTAGTLVKTEVSCHAV